MQIASRPAPAMPAAPTPAAAATAAATPASSFAAALAQAAGAAPTEPPASAAPPVASMKHKGLPPLFKYSDMRMELNDAKADYQQRLSAAIVDQGIDTSVPLKLQTDMRGHVRVVGDHPDKERVEALFAEDFGLQNAFKRMTSIAHLQETVAETVAFQAAYARDPKAAVAQYAHLFNTTTQLTTTQRWGADGNLEVLFNSERVFKPAWG